MATRGFKTKLKGFNKRWKDTRKDVGDSSGGFDTVPTGNYVVGEVKLEITEGQPGLGIGVRCTVLEGEEEGAKASCVQWLESNERSLEFAMQLLNFFGESDVDDLEEDLEPALERISKKKDARYKARIVESGGFNNIYFNAVLDEGEGGDEGDDGKDATPSGGADDLDKMDMDALIDLAEEKGVLEANDLTRRKARKVDEDDLRDMIEKHLESSGGDEDAGGGDAPDLDKLDQDGLLELCDEKDLWEAMGTTKRKARKMDDDDLRDAIEKAMQGGGSGDSGGGDEDGGDELTDQIRNLLVAYGIEAKDDDDLATLKRKAKGYKFPKKELEKHEVAALEKAGMEDRIKG
jgi:hypothetical protein